MTDSLTAQQRAQALREVADRFVNCGMAHSASVAREWADKIDPPVPDHPGPGAVCIDRDGEPWHAGEDGLFRPVGDGLTAARWEDFQEDYGPIKVVWTPGGES